MQEKFELGKMRQALAFIAEKGWLERPPLEKYPLLIERASGAFGLQYTVAHLSALYAHLQGMSKLPPFEEMTAEHFLEATARPATLLREAA